MKKVETKEQKYGKVQKKITLFDQINEESAHEFYQREMQYPEVVKRQRTGDKEYRERSPSKELWPI